MALTISASEMREINRSAILELIRENSPISHSEIAKKLDVSIPTVMRIGSKLIEDEWIRELDEKVWSGGRRRSLLEFNFDGKLIIGVDIGGIKMYGAVSTLAGEILFDHTIPLSGAKGDEAYDLIVRLISKLVKQAKSMNEKLIGIGVGVPGVTDSRKGIVCMAPVLGWQDYPLRNKLEEDFDYPIIIENDANLAAMGELWSCPQKDVCNIVLLYIGVGLGAGVIIERSLYLGSNYSAGQIHRMMPSSEYLKQLNQTTKPEASGISGSNNDEESYNSLGGNSLEGLIESLTTEETFIAANNGDEWANKVIRDSLDYVALLLANINSFFDPDLFILGGRIVRSETKLLPLLKERVNILDSDFPRIALTELGEKAVVMGTIIKVLYKTENHYVVRTMS